VSRERERPTVTRERSSIPMIQGEEELLGPDPGPPVEGREPVERTNGRASPGPHAIGTCRVCDIGVVVLVRTDDSRHGTFDVRAYCIYCNRSLDPHEVAPFSGQ
jgi:hypothetical protein